MILGILIPKCSSDYADLILKPDYADMTCPKPDNADHHYGPINIKYTPLNTLTGFSITLKKVTLVSF